MANTETASRSLSDDSWSHQKGKLKEIWLDWAEINIDTELTTFLQSEYSRLNQTDDLCNNAWQTSFNNVLYFGCNPDILKKSFEVKWIFDKLCLWRPAATHKKKKKIEKETKVGRKYQVYSTFCVKSSILRTKNEATSPHTFVDCGQRIATYFSCSSWTSKPEGQLSDQIFFSSLSPHF